jgi:glycosyltransferase involved in cell wall biosynthesis
MKVGYICSDSEINVSRSEGSALHVRELARGLGQLGHEVFILCAWHGSGGGRAATPIRELRPSGLAAVAWRELEVEPLIENHRLDRDLRSLLYNHWLQDGAWPILQEERPDFLYERYSLFGWGGIELSRRLGVPLLLEVNAPLSVQQRGYERFTLMRTAERIEDEILRAADAVIAGSSGLRSWLVSRGVEEERVRVIPVGVDEDLFGSVPRETGIRRRYGVDEQRVVGFVGSFHEVHDVECLLRAVARVRDDHDRFHLLLVGDGPRRERVEETAERLGLSDRVVFTGEVPHELVPAYLAEVDIAVAPYREALDWWPVPLKVLEYMASGTPTVAAAVGDIAPFVDHGTTGLLYRPGDEAELADAISLLLRTPGLAERIGDAARRHVLPSRTWKTVATQVVELAETLLERSAPRACP